jgi:RNA polymerase sigma factor (sigma-70 family)
MPPVSRVYSAVVGELTPSTAFETGVPIPADAYPQDAVDRVGLLFDAHHQRLYRLARRLAPTSDDARDLVQETFLRAAQAAGSIPVGSPHEEAWLVRVLVNICRDTWRRSAVRRRLDPVRLAGTTTQSANLEDAFIAQTTVWRALERLSPRRRAAIVLYELEGKGIPEIATLLGVTSVTVRWHLSRGRKDLARIISEGKS